MAAEEMRYHRVTTEVAVSAWRGHAQDWTVQRLGSGDRDGLSSMIKTSGSLAKGFLDLQLINGSTTSIRRWLSRPETKDWRHLDWSWRI